MRAPGAADWSTFPSEVRTIDAITTDHVTADHVTEDAPVEAFEARVRALPLALALEHYADEEWKLNSILATWPYLTGEMPHHWNVEVGAVAPDAVLVPTSGTIVRECDGTNGLSRVVVGEGWVATVVRRRDGHVWVSLSASSPDAVAIADEVRGWAQPAPEEPARVRVTFMYCGSSGAYYTYRHLDVPQWADIRRNYAAPVHRAVDRLVALDHNTVPSGRLLLLHGPPGTGKTTLVRALARAWREWCRTYVVVDPEALFTNPNYLFEALLGDDDDDEANRWRLFVVEDCDEFLRADSKDRTGQALSRLLNIADGLIGQGTRVIICITTNEEIGRLHPAVRRPGRCLAEIDVPRLTRAEAREWLGSATPLVGHDASLAELFAIAGGAVVVEDVPAAVGQYL